MSLPEPIIKKLTELEQIVNKHQIYIPLTVVAEFLGMEDDNLRASIEQNRCPFGLEWRQTIKGNRAFKIPTVPFYMWYTQGRFFFNHAFSEGGVTNWIGYDPET